MNIREAKEEIKHSVEIYLEKDEDGEYVVPYMKQRPVLLMGSPGIGRTAIVQQIAEELDVALVTCSMTNYTRQSALGRPLTKELRYGGRTYPVSEYTLGEIMSAIYRVMERSHRKEGILFVSEINCAAESLAPAMNLLLQYKVLGTCSIPKGWVIVAAGTSLRYNRTAKQFQIATLDRVKRLDVEENFNVWIRYAYEQGIHASITSFLELDPERFYFVRASGGKGRYVTARGWEDLSGAVQAYERKEFTVDRNLVSQYITDGEIARCFMEHYGFFQQIRSDYNTDQILEGGITDTLLKKARHAGENERTVLSCLMAGRVNDLTAKMTRQERVVCRLENILDTAQREISQNCISLSVILESVLEQIQAEVKEKQSAHCLSDVKRGEYQKIISYLKFFIKYVSGKDNAVEQYELVRKRWNLLVCENEKQKQIADRALKHALSFAGQAWADREVILLKEKIQAYFLDSAA